MPLYFTPLSALRGMPLLGMAVGAFTADDLTAFEWAYLAHHCKIRPRQLANELSKMAAAIQRQAAEVAGQAVNEGADAAAVQRVLDLAVKMSEWQGRIAAEIPQVDPALF